MSFVPRLQTLLLLLWLAQTVPAAPPPPPPKVAAKGYLLSDYHSGAVLAEQNAEKRLEPASLTKIMTAYVVFRELEAGHIRLQDQVRVSKKAWKTPGSRMFIEVGKKVSVDDLIHGMIIDSGNDACVALAEHVAGSEESFVALMNEQARRLGMLHTHFVNATGLPDPEHYTTPADILKVTRALIHDFPQYYPIYSQRQFTYNGITQKNRNRLLWRDPSVDGVKTGHTKSAGYCLVASAKREGMRLLSVVMGTHSEEARAEESQRLLNYGFRFYQTHRLFEADRPLARVRVWKGEDDAVALGVAEPLYVTIPRGQYDKLQLHTRLRPRITAPLRQGEEVGRLRVELNGDVVAEVPLVALRNVAEGGLLHNLWDSALLLFE